MNSEIGIGRQHAVIQTEAGTRIDIQEPFGKVGRWFVSVEACRARDAVQLRLLDRLVVSLTPEEARELAEALKKAAGQR